MVILNYFICITIMLEASMIDNSENTIKMKIFQKGQVVIPVELRRKYQLEIGDIINVTSTDDGILLKPSLKKVKNESLTDQLYGIFNTHAKNRSAINKKDISKTTENGFLNGWLK